MIPFIAHTADKPAEVKDLEAEYVLEHGVRFCPDRGGVQVMPYGVMKGTATLYCSASRVYVASRGETVAVPGNTMRCTWVWYQNPGEQSVLIITLAEAATAKVIPLPSGQSRRRRSRPDSNG